MGTTVSKSQQEVVRDLLNLYDSCKEKTSWTELSNDVQSSIHQTLILFLHLFPSSKTTVFVSLDGQEKNIADFIYLLLNWKSSMEDENGIELKCWKCIIGWKECYRRVIQYPLAPIISNLESSNVETKRFCLDVLLFMVSRDNFLQNIEKLEKAEVNVKAFVREQKGYDAITCLWKSNLQDDDVLKLSLLIFQSVLVTRVHTTDDETFDYVMNNVVMACCTELLGLCRHPSLPIATLANDFIRSLFLNNCFDSLSAISAFQDSARNCGAILWIFNSALNEAKLLHPSEMSRNIDLFEMLCVGNLDTEALMKRILPITLLVPNWKIPSVENVTKKNGFFSKKQISDFSFSNWLEGIRRRGQRWIEVPQAAVALHSSPLLVWHEEMLYELQDTLANLDNIDVTGFSIEYASIRRELVVNGYFIKPLVKSLMDDDDGFLVEHPTTLCWHVQDRLFVEKHFTTELVTTLKLLIQRYALVINGNLPFNFVVDQLHRRNDLVLYLELVYTAILYGDRRVPEKFVSAGGLNPVVDVIKTRDDTPSIKLSLMILLELGNRAFHLLKFDKGDDVRPMMLNILVERHVCIIELFLQLLSVMVRINYNSTISTLQSSRFFTKVFSVVSAPGFEMTELVATKISKFYRIMKDVVTLTDLLPHGLVQLLLGQRIETFVRVWNSKELVVYADVLWTYEMQNHLYTALMTDCDIVSYDKFSTLVGNYYIEIFQEGNPQCALFVEDWQEVLTAFEEYLWENPNVMIITAIKVLLDIQESLVLSSRTHNVLLGLLDKTIPSSKEAQGLVSSALDVINVAGPEISTVLQGIMTKTTLDSYWNAVDTRFEKIEALDIIFKICDLVGRIENLESLGLCANDAFMQSIVSHCTTRADSYPAVSGTLCALPLNFI